MTLRALSIRSGANGVALDEARTGGDRPEQSEVVPVVIFCGSFFWSLKKMSHQGSSTPLPLLRADFWLDPKTGKKSQGLPKIGEGSGPLR